MQDYLKDNGYNDIKGPRAVITQMATNGMIHPFIWDDLLNSRNELSHIYDEGASRTHLDKIVMDYYPALIEFQEKMQKVL